MHVTRRFWLAVCGLALLVGARPAQAQHDTHPIGLTVTLLEDAREIAGQVLQGQSFRVRLADEGEYEFVPRVGANGSVAFTVFLTEAGARGRRELETMTLLPGASATLRSRPSMRLTLAPSPSASAHEHGSHSED